MLVPFPGKHGRLYGYVITGVAGHQHWLLWRPTSLAFGTTRTTPRHLDYRGLVHNWILGSRSRQRSDTPSQTLTFRPPRISTRPMEHIYLHIRHTRIVVAHLLFFYQKLAHVSKLTSITSATGKREEKAVLTTDLPADEVTL
jgi:hypothetical protein